jgi:hypothetical protein
MACSISGALSDGGAGAACSPQVYIQIIRNSQCATHTLSRLDFPMPDNELECLIANSDMGPV